MNLNEGVYGKQENSETEKLHDAYKKFLKHLAAFAECQKSHNYYSKIIKKTKPCNNGIGT